MTSNRNLNARLRIAIIAGLTLLAVSNCHAQQKKKSSSDSQLKSPITVGFVFIAGGDVGADSATEEKIWKFRQREYESLKRIYPELDRLAENENMHLFFVEVTKHPGETEQEYKKKLRELGPESRDADVWVDILVSW